MPCLDHTTLGQRMICLCVVQQWYCEYWIESIHSDCQLYTNKPCTLSWNIQLISIQSMFIDVQLLRGHSRNYSVCAQWHHSWHEYTTGEVIDLLWSPCEKKYIHRLRLYTSWRGNKKKTAIVMHCDACFMYRAVHTTTPGQIQSRSYQPLEQIYWNSYREFHCSPLASVYFFLIFPGLNMTGSGRGGVMVIISISGPSAMCITLFSLFH